jgi:hypothetical protein
VPIYSPIVLLRVGEYIAAPICPSWPEPSVYTTRSCVGIWRSRSLCARASSSFLSDEIFVVAFSSHHGGRTWGAMCSISSRMYLGYFLTRFSGFDIYGGLPEVITQLIHAWIFKQVAIISSMLK